MIVNRGEAYCSLRKVVSQLGELQGEIATGDMIYGLDRLWRSLLRTRKIIVETLKKQGQIKDGKELPVFDFYSLYCQIYQPRTQDTMLCSGCLSKLDTIVPECPFCGAKSRIEMTQADAIDFNIESAAPNWDIEVDPKEMLQESGPQDIELRPITSRDDIIGPRGKGEPRNRRQDKIATSTRKMVVWMRKREFGKVVPFSPAQLTALGFHDLRTVATLMPNYDPENVSRMDSDELARFILANQGDKPIDPGPPPYGVMPEMGGDQ